MLFVLDETPHAAARSLCDLDVRHQIGRAGQMLAVAHVLCREPVPPMLALKAHGVSVHNQWVKWTAESLHNYLWMHHHAMALTIEFTVRTTHTHAYELDITRMLHPPFILSTEKPHNRTPFPSAPGKSNLDPVLGHRVHYMHKLNSRRGNSLTWARRGIPSWLAL